MQNKREKKPKQNTMNLTEAPFNQLCVPQWRVKKRDDETLRQGRGHTGQSKGNKTLEKQKKKPSSSETSGERWGRGLKGTERNQSPLREGWQTRCWSTKTSIQLTSSKTRGGFFIFSVSHTVSPLWKIHPSKCICKSTTYRTFMLENFSLFFFF